MIVTINHRYEISEFLTSGWGYLWFPSLTSSQRLHKENFTSVLYYHKETSILNPGLLLYLEG